MNPDMARSHPQGLPHIVAVFCLFSFVFHFAWEILQAPLFAGMSDARHWTATLFCLKATVGDVVIAAVSFAVAAWLGNTIAWFVNPSRRATAAYIATGVLITVLFEWYAVWEGRWGYSDLMPIIPLLRVGLSPVLQWVLVPFGVIYFLRHHNFITLVPDARTRD